MYATGSRVEPPRAVSGSPGGNGAVANAQNPSAVEVPAELRAEIERALADLQSKADAAPEDEQAWTLLARARYRAAQLDPAAYLADTEKTLGRLAEIAPDNPEAIRMYGNLAYTRGGFAKAEKHYRRFLELQPNEPNVGTDLASVLLFQGQAEEAKAAFRSVLAKHPDFMQAHFHLGVALHTEGEHEEAETHLAKAFELAPADVKQRIEPFLQAARNRVPHATAVAAPVDRNHAPAATKRAGSTPAVPPSGGNAAGAAQPSNASSEFQKGVDRDLLGHQVFGPRIASIDWTGASAARVMLADFPMDEMPPVVRNKFKSTINEKLARRAEEEGIDENIDLVLVDNATGTIMDHLDGEEWVGAFDESNYE